MKVLLVDDHPLILAALRAVIEELGESIRVIAVESAAAAREALAPTGDFELVLLDLQLADVSGFELLEEFRMDYPGLPVVVISSSDRSSDVIRAIDLGAMGFIPKRSSTETLEHALRRVMSGGIYVPTMRVSDEAEPAVWRGRGQPPLRESAANAALQDLSLTPRQTEVLNLLLQGKPNKIIARELGVSVETIKDHVAAVLKALGVSSRTQAVLAVGQMRRWPDSQLGE